MNKYLVVDENENQEVIYAKNDSQARIKTINLFKISILKLNGVEKWMKKK